MGKYAIFDVVAGKSDQFIRLRAVADPTKFIAVVNGAVGPSVLCIISKRSRW